MSRIVIAAILLLDVCGSSQNQPPVKGLPGATGTTGASGQTGATGVSGISGRTGPTGTVAPAAPAGPAGAGCASPPPGVAGFWGFIRDASSNRVELAEITVIRKEPPALQIQVHSDPQGCWSTPHSGGASNLTAGNYNITVEKAGFRRQTVAGVALAAGPSQVDVTLMQDPCHASGANIAAVLLVILFLVTIYFARWHNIAVPGRRRLIARIDDLLARMGAPVEAPVPATNEPPARAPEPHQVVPTVVPPAEPAAPAGPNMPSIPAESPRVTHLRRIRKSLQDFGWNTVKGFLFWSLGEENAAWYTIHFTELELMEKVPLPFDRVLARLYTAQSQLSISENVASKAMAERIKNATNCDDPRTREATLRELLQEVQYHLYDASDTGFADLTSWQNKAIWLTKIGLFLAIVLALAVGNWILFVAGAAGGFLSRLSQQLKRANVPTDYGASWSTLFLSPVLGALSGWFGVLMIAFASDPQFQLIGGPLKQVQWDDPCAPSTLFAAFLLGFSERLFDGLVSRLNDQIQKGEDAAKKGPEGPPPPLPKAKPPAVNLTPTTAKAEAEVSASLAGIDPAKVTKMVFVSSDGKEAEATITKREGSTVTFLVPKVAPGNYTVRVFAPDKTDATTPFTVTA